MIVLLLFILTAQESAAVVMPGRAPVDTGPALEKPQVDCPGLLSNFTLGTQLLNLNPEPTPVVLWEYKETSGVYGDISEDDLPKVSSLFISLESLQDAGQKLQLDRDEFPPWTNPECPFRFNLLDAFKTVSEASQVAHFMTAKILYIGVPEASVVDGQAQLSNLKRQLKGGPSTPNKTTALMSLFYDFLSHICHDPSTISAQQPGWLRYEEATNLQLVLCVLGEVQIPSYLVAEKAPERIQPQGSPGETGLSFVQAGVAQGIVFPFTIHIHVKKMETRLAFSVPYVTVQDACSLKSLPRVSYRLGDINVKFDSTPLLAYQETVVPRYPAPQSVSRVYPSCTAQPRLQDAVEKNRSMARIQNVPPQRATDAPNTHDTLLNKRSVNVTPPCKRNSVQVLPPRCFLSVPNPTRHPTDPKYLFLFRGHRPYVKQLFYSTLKSQKGPVNRLVLDYYDSHVTRHSLPSYFPQLFYLLSFLFFVFTFVWSLEQFFAGLGNWPELAPMPFVNEDMRNFRLLGELVMRYLCCNVLENY